MMKVLFVCTGNICRSPMAEAVIRHRAEEMGVEIETDSAGTISYHVGEKADPRTINELEKNGIKHDGVARQVRRDDFYEYDLILGMSTEHVARLKVLKPNDASAEIELFLDYADNFDGDVPDPYYVEGFDGVYKMVEDGVKGILKFIREKDAKK